MCSHSIITQFKGRCSWALNVIKKWFQNNVISKHHTVIEHRKTRVIKVSCVIDVTVHIWCISMTGLSEHWWQCVLTYQTKQGVPKKWNMKLCAISQLYYSAELCVHSIYSIHLYLSMPPLLKLVSLQCLDKEENP